MTASRSSQTSRETCAFCGKSFELPPRRRGPAPAYCCRAHRQRAYEARLTRRPHESSATSASLPEVLAETQEAVAAAPGNLRVLSGAYQRLAAAVATTLSAAADAATLMPTAMQAPANPVTVTQTPQPRRPRRAATKPWKVLFHAAETEPAAGEVLSAHTTEAAAQRASRRYRQTWEPRQVKVEIPRWSFSVVADPEDALGEGNDRAEAKARAARLVVRTQPREHGVIYRRYPDPERPAWIHLLREEGGLTEALSSRWHQGPDGYARSAYLGAAGDHPYAGHLLEDACGLAYLGPREAPHQLAELRDAISAFVAEVLNPRGETFSISAGEILAWLEARGVVAIVAGATR